MFCCNFSDKVLEHFTTPRNSESMVDADSIGTAGDSACGDSLTLYIKVKENIIEDISFMVFGCVAAIATSSMTTELAKGKSLDEAYKINDQYIAHALDGLPEQKIHCSVLGATALRQNRTRYCHKGQKVV